MVVVVMLVVMAVVVMLLCNRVLVACSDVEEMENSVLFLTLFSDSAFLNKPVSLFC